MDTFISWGLHLEAALGMAVVANESFFYILSE